MGGLGLPSTFSPGSHQQGLPREGLCLLCCLYRCPPVPACPRSSLEWRWSGVQEVRGRGWNPLMAKECAPVSAQWSLVPRVRREAGR